MSFLSKILTQALDSLIIEAPIFERFELTKRVINKKIKPSCASISPIKYINIKNEKNRKTKKLTTNDINSDATILDITFCSPF